MTTVLPEVHFVGGRCWRDFFSFSFSCSHLIGNKFTPCAQAGSVLPVLVLRVGSLPVFLCPPGPFLVFPLPVQLQKARTEQFWWLLAFWQDQPSPGSSKGLFGGCPICGTCPLEEGVPPSAAPALRQRSAKQRTPSAGASFLDTPEPLDSSIPILEFT